MTDRSVSASETTDAVLAAWRARWSPNRPDVEQPGRTAPTPPVTASVPSVRPSPSVSAASMLTAQAVAPMVAQAALSAVMSAYRDD